MKKRISALCTALMLCAAMFAGCSQASAEEGVPSFDTPGGVKVQNISASWHKSYNSIEALAADSDLIALVEITDEERVEQHESLYFTISTANVLETVYSTEDVETVEIYQTGCRTDTELIQIAEDPLMNEGEKWFIFARRNEDGTYTILGPFGRFAYGGEGKPFTWLPDITMEGTLESEELSGGVVMDTLQAKAAAAVE
ncbi:MAG: hypothetical protein ACLU62_02680 [Hydrogeniiclostridium sp.]